MTRPLLCAALLIAWALPGTAAVPLSEPWLRAQQAMAAGDLAVLERRVAELVDAAEEADARRLTPYSRALLAWSQQRPAGERAQLIDLAERLDPGLAAVHFLRARRAATDGRWVTAAASYMHGWAHLASDRQLRPLLLASTGAWLLVSLALVLVVGLLLQSARFLPELAHDANELGLVVFQRVNAVVFAAVILVLPVFAGLGPVWLVAWLCALTIVYMPVRQRVLAAAVWLLIVALIPLAEGWQRLALRRAPVVQEAAALLAERRIDPQVVQELLDLEPHLGQHPTYQLLIGELQRLHGDAVGARLHLQQAAVSSPRDGLALTLLGNLAFEEGNTARAIQQYSDAVERDPALAVAHYNLSYAYDRNYRFEDADRARQQARQLDPQLDAAGRSIVQPDVGEKAVNQLVAAVSPAQRAAVGLGSPRLEPLQWLIAPFPLAFLIPGALGGVLLWLRSRFMWRARSCTRCGKVFCSRCKSATESDSYCSQCISVFLKREKVPIEQQSLKIRQIRGWERARSVVRRAAAVLFPGGGIIVGGRWSLGLAVALVAITTGLAAVLWLPVFVRDVEPAVIVLPLQVILIMITAAAWLWGVRAAWQRR